MVRRGNWLEWREKRNGVGAKREIVPVPVRSERGSPVLRIWFMRERYWCSGWDMSVEVLVVVAEAVELEVFRDSWELSDSILTQKEMKQ